MSGQEFRLWRERVGLTQQQIAERLKVTRTTIQNWEAGATNVPEAVAVSCEILERRLKQESPSFGPLTLVYSDAPLFINAYGPRGRTAMIQPEAYRTNVAVLARVQQLWGRDTFHNPFVIDERHATLWNAIELEKVVRGADKDAPTLVNLLRAMAQMIRSTCTLYATSGGGKLSGAEAAERERSIREQADALERLTDSGLAGILHAPLEIDRIIAALHGLGTMAPEALLTCVAEAMSVFSLEAPHPEQMARLERDTWILEYRGCVITWPKLRMESSRWTVNVASNDPALFVRLGSNIVINNTESLAEAVAEARGLIDGIHLN